jgi:hypothetical protein
MKKIITIALFISTFLFGCSSSDDSSSDSGQWQLTALNTNSVVNKLCSAGNTIYVSNGSEISKSTDNGDTWSIVNTGLTNVTSYDIFVINGEIHLSATKYLTSSVETKYYKSNNNGDTWVQVWNALSSSNLGNGFHPKIVYLVGSKLFGAVNNDFGISRIFNSSDNGSTWNLLSTTFSIQSPFQNNFMFDGTNYYITDMNGLYKSSNGINYTLNNDFTYGFKYSAILGNKIYYSAGSDMSYSDNGGSSWLDINSGLPLSLSFLYSNGQNIYTGGASGVYVLNNNTWNQLGYDIQQVFKVTTTNNYIFALAEGGLYRYNL